MLERFVFLVLAEIGHDVGAVLRVPALSVSMRSLALMVFVDLGALIDPALRIVLLVFFLPAGKHAFEIFSVLVVFGDQNRSVGVTHEVLAEVQLVLQGVANQAAEENNV